jgi:hypothetical protein
VKIAVVDTGVNLTHPDLEASIDRVGGLVNGYDFVNNDAIQTMITGMAHTLPVSPRQSRTMLWVYQAWPAASKLCPSR